MRRFLFVLLAVLVAASPPLAAPARAADPQPGTGGFSGTATIAPNVVTPMAASGSPLAALQSFALTGGYIAAGVGMRNRGFGSIAIDGVPVGATVRAAYLFWDVLGNSLDSTFSQGQINGQPIAGVLIGSGGNPCWGNAANFAYRADVTSLVTGNGVYSLTGFASHITDGRDPWDAYDNTPPLAEGASLVVVYESPSAPQTQVVIYNGATEDYPTTLTQSITGFTAGPSVTAKTTFIGADGQDSYEQDSTFNGVAVPSADFNGLDPQAGPAFVHGNLWDTRTVDVSSMIAPGSTSATVTVNGAFDCHVWVGQVLSISSGAQQPNILFVHGIKADYSNPDLYKDLLDPLRARFGANTVSTFEYYYDAACDNAWPAIPAVDPAAADFPLDTSTPPSCSSTSDLGANTLVLELKVRQLYEQTGQPVILIGNSMGAAITRGMLAYSLQTGDGVANRMVDSVYYLEGAQQGSIILANLGGRQPARDIFSAAVSVFLQTYFNYAGQVVPAAADLVPQSLWYEWVNRPGRVADIPTYNIYGDITVAYNHCDFWFANCHLDTNNPTRYGDILLLPGDSNPTATPVGGGAKYLNGALGPDNYQWGLHYNYAALSPGSETLATDIEAVSNLWNTSPASHNVFEAHIGTTTVPDCVDGMPTTIPDEIIKFISSRMAGQPLQCTAQWGDR